MQFQARIAQAADMCCGPLEKKHKLRIGSSDRWIRIVVPVQKHTECCGIQSTDTPGRSDNS